MKIKKQNDQSGGLRYFEIDNLQVSKRGLTRMIASCPGIKITKHPRFFDDDLFCQFEINNHQFFVEEPWGDNSTYNVVAPEAGLPEMEQLAEHIEALDPLTGGDLGHSLYFISGFIAKLLMLYMLVVFVMKLF